jgi:hypothetical protein
LAGATVTVSRGQHEISLGDRQRSSSLELALRCSLGEDFLLDLPPEAEITSLKHSGKALPVRKDGSKLIIPLRPGEQSATVAWKINQPLKFETRAEAVKLPVEGANIATVITVPENRWVLWANGPTRGPAVRFWGILVCSLLAAIALGSPKSSPLRRYEWMLLVIGLTQVPLPAALFVVAWFYFLAWRSHDSFQAQPPSRYNFLQVALLGATAMALGILLVAVGEGLLGRPDMFIRGNGSTPSALRWYQARTEMALPTPGCFSVSVWWYRFFMLAWALWLAGSLIRWLRWAWESFSKGGITRRKPVTPPPLTVRTESPTPPATEQPTN